MNSHEFIRKANAAAARAAMRTPPNRETSRVVESFIGALIFPKGQPSTVEVSFSDYTADRLLHDMRIEVAPPTPTE